MSIGSLYQYFPSKEALVAALAERHMEEMTSQVAAGMERVANLGLKDAVRILDGVEDIAICRLTASDVVRHVLVQRIIAAYEAHEKKTGPDSNGRPFKGKAR